MVHNYIRKREIFTYKDVNTTRKHYAAMEDQRRRMAAGKIQLREK